MTVRASIPSSMLLAFTLSAVTADAASSHVFSKRFGGTSDQSITGVAVDGGGNVVITGSFAGSVDFGGGTLTSAGGLDAFVARFDALGNHLWSRTFGDASAQAGNGVAVDGSGDVFLTGYFEGTVSFGGGALASAGTQDVFVVRLDADGNHVWSKRFGNASDQRGAGIAVVASGGLVTIGTLYGSIDFGGGTLTSAGLGDVYLARLDASGNHVWSKRFGDAGAQSGAAVAVDGSGYAMATGSFSGSVSFGGGVLTSAGSTDVFLARYDSGGSHVWSKRFGDASAQDGTELSCDAAGNPVLAGSFSGKVDFGGGSLTSAGLGDAFLAKFDTSGSLSWSRAFGSTGADVGGGLAVDGSRDVVLTGSFQGSVDFGGGALTAAGGSDLFVARFSASGVHVSSARAGDALGQEGLSAAIDVAGNVLFAGRFQGTVDFGGGVLTSAGGYDGFLAKLGQGSSLRNVTPCRVLDTRSPTGTWGGPALAPAPSSRVFPIAGVCGIPATARAVAANLTVTQTAASGSLRLYPGDTGSSWIPTATAISFGTSTTRANNGRFLLSRDGVGSLGVQNDAAGTVHFILDVTGYFE